MLPQVIDSPRPTASPRALPVGAGEPLEERGHRCLRTAPAPMGAGSGPPGRAARGWRGHVQRTPRKPRASWPRCKEPWKRATGKKIKRSLAETEQRRERGYNSLLILAGSRHRWEPAISLGCEPRGCEAAGGRGGGRNLLPALSRPHPCPLCCCSSGQDS